MHIKLNPNNVKTPEQTKALKAYQEANARIERLGKELQGADDQVNIDFNQSKGEVELDKAKLDNCSTYSGYAKFDPATGKIEKLEANQKFVMEPGGLCSGHSDFSYKYEETAENKKIEFHCNSNYDTMGLSGDRNEVTIKDYKFIVDNKNGDIDCDVNLVEKQTSISSSWGDDEPIHGQPVIQR